MNIQRNNTWNWTFIFLRLKLVVKDQVEGHAMFFNVTGPALCKDFFLKGCYASAGKIISRARHFILRGHKTGQGQDGFTVVTLILFFINDAFAYI